MKVENMQSARGNDVPNQFIITDEASNTETFQSYDSVIAVKSYEGGYKVTLDRATWDYSVTTGKYRNQFLGETKKETEAKIDSGEYKLADLN